MRLKKIKLAGFKSFVDPTIVPFPGNLVCIVGPNGCGKSNIIDAVRWVMGESSARQLRGESMADVIFNGSVERKPVGQASIELVFDNRQGSVGGQYANYSEISVKRYVNRDGKSGYMLNGTRCRRRDITDIFLGTGLGPRSYSIIEQGMISRFVEAKPDELRIFIEEAAGISKYKERRRETEGRIKNTKENILRINDLVAELDKRIKVLQKQSQTAERYKELKEQERLLKAQLVALKLMVQQDLLLETSKRIRAKETELEAMVAKLRNIEAHIEKVRSEHVKATDSFNLAQGDFYGAGAEIARLEQAIEHAAEIYRQQQSDLAGARQALDEALEHQKNDQHQLQYLAQQLKVVQPRLTAAQSAENESLARLADVENKMHLWQRSWEEFNHNVADEVRNLEVEQAHLQRLKQQMMQFEQRRDRLKKTLSGLDYDHLERDAVQLQREKEMLDGKASRCLERLRACRDQIAVQREYNQQFGLQLNEEQNALQSARGRIASLKELQQAALGKSRDRSEGSVNHWLERTGLQERSRLAQEIEIEPGWERALEVVLGVHLEAVCVERITALTDSLDGFDKGVLGLFEMGSGLETPVTKQPRIQRGLLSEKIRSGRSLSGLLVGVYAADSLDDALELRSELQPGESVVTRSGTWLGSDWLRVSKEADEKSGVLLREQEIKALEQQIAELQSLVTQHQESLDRGNDKLRQHEEERERVQNELQGLQKSQGELEAEIGAKKARAAQMREQRSHTAKELDELAEQIQLADQEIANVTQGLAEAQKLTELHDRKRAEMEAMRDAVKRDLDKARQMVRTHKDAVHDVALQIESLTTRQQITQNNLERMQTQLVRLKGRCEDLSKALSRSKEPEEELKARLQQALARKVATEAGLQESRNLKEGLEHDIRVAEGERQLVERKIQQLRDELEKARINRQAVEVRCQTLIEQMQQSGFELQAIVDTIPEKAEEDLWKAKIEKVTAHIARLGVVNLAAIDECKEQTERWQYLIDQKNDLDTALETLESAIRKIDRETRARFKETYDKINSGLKSFFPRLFGGGDAYLELTGDDLLDAGVTIMAHPPGKRNSTIHLLSGGEKALTAVALVFAIFEINPSPFCMLDEVDAPLDDANVGRFCQVVKEMSEQVQFIFISHNKVTMELAEHLMGVTMHEAGVSRIVAVDVNDALEIIA